MPLPVLHAGRDTHLYLPGAPLGPSAAAGRAGDLDLHTRAATGSTGVAEGEHPLIFVDHAAAPAHRANTRRRPGAAPLPPQVEQAASEITLTVVVAPFTASSKDRCSSASTSSPRWAQLPPSLPVPGGQLCQKYCRVESPGRPPGSSKTRRRPQREHPGRQTGCRRTPAGSWCGPRRTPCVSLGRQAPRRQR